MEQRTITAFIRTLVLILFASIGIGIACPQDDHPGDLKDGERDDRCASGLRVSTFAGPEFGEGASPGYADGFWNTARFNTPTYVLSYMGTQSNPVDGLLLSDTGNHVVRIILNGLEVQTLAGTPKAAGFQDGYRTVALFNHPAGLATDAAGNIYIADSENRAIRRMDPDGNVTTVAGRTRPRLISRARSRTEMSWIDRCCSLPTSMVTASRRWTSPRRPTRSRRWPACAASPARRTGMVLEGRALQPRAVSPGALTTLEKNL